MYYKMKMEAPAMDKKKKNDTEITRRFIKIRDHLKREMKSPNTVQCFTNRQK